MRMTTSVLASLGVLAITAPAYAVGLKSNYQGDVSAPIGTLNVSVSDEVAAEPKRIGKRTGDDLNAIGPRDSARLVEELRESLEAELSRNGVLNPTVARPAYTLDVTIVEARPSNLEFTDAYQRQATRISGVGQGGAKLQARLVDASGAVVADYEYDWRALDISQASPAPWGDAEIAFDRFARRLASELEDKGATTN